jgi:hypothetical protein
LTCEHDKLPIDVGTLLAQAIMLRCGMKLSAEASCKVLAGIEAALHRNVCN